MTFGMHTTGPEPGGAIPLDEEDLVDLIPDFVTTRADVNVVEQENIMRAVPRARQRAIRDGPTPVFEYAFIFDLHRRMFGDVWKWAGTQRRRATNIGVEPGQIPEQLKQALLGGALRR